jgi:hypothetical protein
VTAKLIVQNAKTKPAATSRIIVPLPPVKKSLRKAKIGTATEIRRENVAPAIRTPGIGEIR